MVATGAPGGLPAVGNLSRGHREGDAPGRNLARRPPAHARGRAGGAAEPQADLRARRAGNAGAAARPAWLCGVQAACPLCDGKCRWGRGGWPRAGEELCHGCPRGGSQRGGYPQGAGHICGKGRGGAREPGGAGADGEAWLGADRGRAEVLRRPLRRRVHGGGAEPLPGRHPATCKQGRPHLLRPHRGGVAPAKLGRRALGHAGGPWRGAGGRRARPRTVVLPLPVLRSVQPAGAGAGTLRCQLQGRARRCLRRLAGSTTG